jgi:hypothetical protein
MTVLGAASTLFAIIVISMDNPVYFCP